MRDVLPIAVFEQVQLSNWRSRSMGSSAYDICDGIASYRVRLEIDIVDPSQVLDPDVILDVNSKLCASMEGCELARFEGVDEWQAFVDELTAGSRISDIPFQDSGAWLLSQLFSTHLRTLRLLTAWLLVDALARTLEQPRLTISQTGLGLLLKDLSFAGPPLFDAEDMRSAFPDRYR